MKKKKVACLRRAISAERERIKDAVKLSLKMTE